MSHLYHRFTLPDDNGAIYGAKSPYFNVIPTRCQALFT